MKNNIPLHGGIDGGTNFVCAIGTDAANLPTEARFPTTSPQATLNQVIDFFGQQEIKFWKLASIGFACFGLLDPQPDSKAYGYILPTPKRSCLNQNL